MEKKNNEYRLSDVSSSDEVYTKLSNAKGMSFSDSGWWHISSKDSEIDYLWQWGATELLPEERKSSYTYKDYTFEYMDAEYKVTLVIYII